MVVDKCKFCSERDKFIVAALAQNGPGFTIANIDQLERDHLINNSIDWEGWYKILSNKSKKKECRIQWRLFYRYAKMLNEDKYYLPENILEEEKIIWLKNQ
jgi:hypothetical protein